MVALARVDGVVEVAVGDHRQRRAELLLVHDPGALAGAGEDGRLEEVAGTVDRRAAGRGARAARERVGDQLADPLVLRPVVDRAELVALGPCRRRPCAAGLGPTSASTTSSCSASGT